ncbi:pentapeptide repeat-containing protein [Phormidium yuhuli AB48]|uniref:Pentapeptide repeat-containing protein n=1 Tax=Phormidium yuhuli AB48 TaxID=2940671 RepID=A0ABY5AUP3_9CYAN|nr:pentapeptide repeat-containing protein [Phormidium yuhuli]USR92497.1 pentapeptide repeat-containing protein [Phormidium yuhuli AB48]
MFRSLSGRSLAGIAAILVSCVIAVMTLSPTALAEGIDPPLLTEAMLQQRLERVKLDQGQPVIDLSQVTIDLRGSSLGETGKPFADSFYRQLRPYLNRPSFPPQLDLTGSQIRGRFRIQPLSLNVPLYGQQLSLLLSENERKQLERDRRRRSQLQQLSSSLIPNSPENSGSNFQVRLFRGKLILDGTDFLDDVDWNNTFFLGGIEGRSTVFRGEVQASESRFSKQFKLTQVKFLRPVGFHNSIFFTNVNLNRVQFQGELDFTGATFELGGNFRNGQFKKLANFADSKFLETADFSETIWRSRGDFSKSKFIQSLYFTDSMILDNLSFRETQFLKSVNFREGSFQKVLDFSDAQFNSEAYLNISNLTFDANESQLIGNPGKIGRVLSIPTLQGNENLLINLVRNFRELEQIEDANQVNYKRIILVQRDLVKRVFASNLNTASRETLRQIGFSQAQIAEILQHRQEQVFSSLSEMLSLETVSLNTYTQVRDRLIAVPPITWKLRLYLALKLGFITLLLALSRYGTSFALVFGVGAIAIAYFASLFWLIDRYRRLRPQRIVPTVYESLCVLVTTGLIFMIGVIDIIQSSPQPGLTLACLGVVMGPIPGLLTLRMYQQGRYHDLMDVSYFVEDGAFRELRLMISRLPIMPRFPFFRDRFEPILCDRRWGWLNYYDFSLNNLLKFGFNDIRLRDRQLPGLIAALAWYQWGLGILYISLLFWTLSRTIPGLNLFLYF